MLLQVIVIAVCFHAPRINGNMSYGATVKRSINFCSLLTHTHKQEHAHLLFPLVSLWKAHLKNCTNQIDWTIMNFYDSIYSCAFANTIIGERLDSFSPTELNGSYKIELVHWVILPIYTHNFYAANEKQWNTTVDALSSPPTLVLLPLLLDNLQRIFPCAQIKMFNHHRVVQRI